MSLLKITFNGEERETESRTVSSLLREFGLENRKIAVELNREIVARETYDDTALTDGDSVEVVQFVGGG